MSRIGAHLMADHGYTVENLLFLDHVFHLIVETCGSRSRFAPWTHALPVWARGAIVVIAIDEVRAHLAESGNVADCRWIATSVDDPAIAAITLGDNWHTGYCKHEQQQE